jgi:hypothetical protein
MQLPYLNNSVVESQPLAAAGTAHTHTHTYQLESAADYTLHHPILIMGAYLVSAALWCSSSLWQQQGQHTHESAADYMLKHPIVAPTLPQQLGGGVTASGSSRDGTGNAREGGVVQKWNAVIRHAQRDRYVVVNDPRPSADGDQAVTFGELCRNKKKGVQGGWESQVGYKWWSDTLVMLFTTQGPTHDQTVTFGELCRNKKKGVQGGKKRW